MNTVWIKMNDRLRRTSFKTFKHGINFEISFWLCKQATGITNRGIHRVDLCMCANYTDVFSQSLCMLFVNPFNATRSLISLSFLLNLVWGYEVKVR